MYILSVYVMYLLVDGQLTCFCLLAVVTSAAADIRVFV